jgi:hypothetical protein
MKSPDGAQHWATLDNRPIPVPAVADDGGPAQRITCDDEFDAHTWLSNVLAKAGKLHFLYLAQTQPPREHYVRYDLATGHEDLRLSPDFGGQRIKPRQLSGFFASRAADPDAPLYCVSGAQGRIGCLVSRDSGQSWQDYALSEQMFALYSIGGCREPTRDGYVIGSFTDQARQGAEEEKHPRVYFFRIAVE